MCVSRGRGSAKHFKSRPLKNQRHNLMKSMHIAALSGNNTCVGCERSVNRSMKHYEEISAHNFSRSDNNKNRTGKEAGSENKIPILQGVQKMANSKKNAVPAARAALDQFKMEAANEVGVNLNNSYNGDITARQAGSVGGQMVKKMIESYEMSNKQ